MEIEWVIHDDLASVSNSGQVKIMTIKTIPLGQLCLHVFRGIQPIWGDGLIMLTQGCIRNNRVDFSKAKRHDDYQRPVDQASLIQQYDIILNSSGVRSYGRTAQVVDVPSPATINNHMLAFRPNPALIDPRYLGIVIRSYEKEIKTFSEGTTDRHIYSKRMEILPIPVPDRETQKVIVSFVESIDKFRYVLEEQNRLLEEQAHGIFRDLSKGDTVMVKAKDLIEFNPTETLKRDTVSPYLDMSMLSTTRSWPAKPPKFREYKGGTHYRNGDSIMAKITPCLENGKAAFVQCFPDNTIGFGSTEFIVMRSRPYVAPAFGYLLAKSEPFKAQGVLSMHGTSGRQRANVETLMDYQLAIPSDKDTWNNIQRHITSIFDAIRVNTNRIETLKNFTDYLLPKIINGDVKL